ncbi:MAG: OB-fold nucleic acid binding domain-containing protein, partial [Acidimicrobiales bacterium]
ALAGGRPDRLPGTVPGVIAPTLPEMSAVEELAADLFSIGISPDDHPVAPARTFLRQRGVVPAADLQEREAGRILVAGIVTHRQRPSTAGGTIFLNLEDETGVVNVICSPGLWTRYRGEATSAPALIVRGRLEGEGVARSVVAERLEVLELPTRAGKARNFR